MVLGPAQRLVPLASATGLPAGGIAWLIMLTIGLLVGLLLVVILLISLRRSGQLSDRPRHRRSSARSPEHADAWSEAGRRTRPLDPPPEDNPPS